MSDGKITSLFQFVDPPCECEPNGEPYKAVFDTDTKNPAPLRVYTRDPQKEKLKLKDLLAKTSTQLFLDRLAELSHQNVQLACAKNADYANDGDPFGNFTLCEKLGISSTEGGLMVRMTDKVARIANLLQRAPQVNESILDALSDLANYALILRIWLEWQQK